MTREDKIISEMIYSFKGYALGDIKYNRKKPIAAFILSICFIDQLASFRYPLSLIDLDLRCESFITEYLPRFKGIKMYSIFRKAVIHNYSGKRRFAVTNDRTFKKPHDTIKGKTIINTNELIKELIKGFKKFEAELLINGSDSRINALKRERKHPPFMYNNL